MVYRFFFTAMFAILLIPFPFAWADTPTQVVENLHGELLAVMKEAESLGYEGRYHRLEPVIKESYDLPIIARLVVGRHWRRFNQEQRAQFLDAFSRMSVANYAGRLDAYSGEFFKTLSTESLKPGRVMVTTKLVKPHDKEIELRYILQEREMRYRIVNVIAEGVSDLSLKRADYSGFLKENEFQDLLKKIEENITHFSK